MSRGPYLMIVVWRGDDGRLVVAKEGDKQFFKIQEGTYKKILTECPLLEDYLNDGAFDLVALVPSREDTWYGVVKKDVSQRRVIHTRKKNPNL